MIWYDVIWHYFKLENDLHHQKIYYGTWKWWLAQSPWARFSMFKTSIYSRQILGLVSYHDPGWKNPCCGCAGSEGLCHYWHLFCLCLFVWLPKKYITKLTPWNLTHIHKYPKQYLKGEWFGDIFDPNHPSFCWYLCQNFGGVNPSLQSFFGVWNAMEDSGWGREEDGSSLEVVLGLLFLFLHGWSTPLSLPTPEGTFAQK